MKTISIINNKGGVGKTTTTINLGYEFSQHFGKKVILTDLDPQSNLTKFFGIDESSLTIAHVIFGAANLRQAIQQTKYQNLDIIPACEDLKVVWDKVNTPGGETTLRNILAEIESEYDICIIDNAPALGISTDNALVASDEVIVPICIDTFGFWGLDKIMRDIERARQINPSLYFDGCLITRFTNDEISQEVTRQMKQQETYPVFTTHIRESKTVKRAAFAGQPITENSLRSGAAVDYRILAQKYIENNLCS
ncbi:ParA family protein [Sporomusa sphaeroides DSM 2875]|uniref:ParA family protein n=1 Tax=Sporomusa sphaeroides TaxID=47679 RepID=UPI00202E81A8|nr:ParA family protein [Sporomusa sphaeroides]MCM0760488.1 ParA family protein [Sporomusa sphaeroides DSM 2875]